MAHNYLEQIVSEWYEFNGYFVRRNVNVGLRPNGGYECELDVVAFHPGNNHLVHVEPSMDADSWATRESRYLRKFNAGQQYIPTLFTGLNLPEEIEKIALFGIGSRLNHQTIGGGRILLFSELLITILESIQGLSIGSKAVPEDKPILRTLQFVSQNRQGIIDFFNSH